VKLWERKQ